MPVNICENCGGEYSWKWEEAFDKFGFSDGDGQVETHSVTYILEMAGYDTDTIQWGMHNCVIVSIKKDGKELMPKDDDSFIVGYDDPRSYLPEEIIQLLDKELSE